METERYILDDKGVFIIKEGVDMIREREFKGMDQIKKAIIPGTVDSIGDHAFAGCKSLREIVLSEGVRLIWENAFRCCYKLKKVQLPSSLERICSSAFAHCGLKEAVVHSNTWIDNHVFDGCEALEKVIIRDVKPNK